LCIKLEIKQGWEERYYYPSQYWTCCDTFHTLQYPGVLWNFFSSCVIFSDPFYPTSSSCQRARFTVWQLSIYSVKCQHRQGLGSMWKAAVMA